MTTAAWAAIHREINAWYHLNVVNIVNEHLMGVTKQIKQARAGDASRGGVYCVTDVAVDGRSPHTLGGRRP